MGTQVHKRFGYRSGLSFRLLLLLAVVVGQCCLAPFSAMAMPMAGGLQAVTIDTHVDARDGVMVAADRHDFCCDDAMGTIARVSITFPSDVDVLPVPRFVVPAPATLSATHTNRGPPPTLGSRPFLQVFLI